MSDVKGKVVLITGGASGIGRAVALKFASGGARVVLWDINPEMLGHAVEEIKSTGAEAFGYAVDATDRAMVQETAARVKSELGGVDILDNNAGVVFGGDFLDLKDENLLKTFDVNINSYMWCTRAFLPDMISKGKGHIVMMSSAAGLLGVPGMAAYCASKHAVIGLSESIRLELRKKGIGGIRFTIVCPSYVTTGMFDGVRPPLLTPWLSTDRLADKIFKAVRKNRLYVREPFMVKTVPLLKAIPWSWIADWVGDLLGMNKSMDTWKGR